MDIDFVQNKTKKGQDGFTLSYKIDGQNIDLNVSRTFLGMINVEAYTTKDLFEQVKFQPFIKYVVDLHDKTLDPIKEISIDGSNTQVNGKITYTSDETKNFFLKK